MDGSGGKNPSTRRKIAGKPQYRRGISAKLLDAGRMSRIVSPTVPADF
jgi:hypothetical protein